MMFIARNLVKVVLDPKFRENLPEWKTIFERIDDRNKLLESKGVCVTSCAHLVKPFIKKMKLDVMSNRDMAERVRAYFGVKNLEIVDRSQTGKLRVLRIASISEINS